MFFFGFVIILRNVSKTLAFTTRLGARFSNHEMKSINPPTLRTIIELASYRLLCSSVQSSWKGVQVQCNITRIRGPPPDSHTSETESWVPAERETVCIMLASLFSPTVFHSLSTNGSSFHLSEYSV